MNESYLKEVRDLEPVTTEKKLEQKRHFTIATVAGIVVILIELFAVISFELSILNGTILAIVLVIFYAIVLFFLLEPGILRETKHTQIQTFEKPIVQTIEKPVIKEVIVEKPVPYREEVIVDRPVIQTVEKPVYITEPRKKLDIPKYEYVASSEAKVYHKRTCRLGKLIKKKYKESNNSENFFKKKKYVPCKMCIKR